MSEPRLPGYLRLTREPDDYIEVDGQTIRVVRISLGGNEEVGHYCIFRGEPAEVVSLLENALWAMRVKFAMKPLEPGEGKS